MRSGRLRKEIAFERREDDPDGFNENRGSWVEFATRYAGIEPLGHRPEFLAALQTHTDADVRIVTRWDPILATVTTKDRIVHEQRIYDIRSIVNPNERDRELQFLCTEHQE